MAETQTGKWSLKRLSRLTDLDSGELSIPALVSLGVVVAVVHRFFDYNLGLPGHHGLEFFTALFFARLVSTRPLAAALVASGTVGGDLALTTELLHSFKNVPLYFLAALLVDGFYFLLGRHCRILVIAALVGAVSFVIKPLILLVVAAMADVAFGFMRHGPYFALVTHASFGAIGAICGALLARAWNHHKPSPKTN